MAVNYGRERPNPPHLNPNAPQAANVGKRTYVPPVPTGPAESFPSTSYQIKQGVSDFNNKTVPTLNARLPRVYPRVKKMKG